MPAKIFNVDGKFVVKDGNCEVAESDILVEAIMEAIEYTGAVIVLDESVEEHYHQITHLAR